MIDILAMVLGAALALVSGAAFALALDVHGRAAALLATMTIAAATIVLSGLALSVVDALSTGPWLAAQAVLAAAAVVGAWRLARRVPRVDVRAFGAELRAGLRAHPAVAVLVLGVGAAIVVQAISAVLVAPQNGDVAAYHLSKAAHWLQHESATQFVGGSWRQLYTPPNAELLQAWTMSLSGADHLANLVQWLACVACGLAIHLGARAAGFPRAASVFAGALFVAMPQVVMQAATSQNDLVAAAFTVTSGLFAVRGLRDGHRGELVVAGIAAGLAVGTKGTAFLVAPGLALIVAVVLLRRRPTRRVIATGVAAFAIGIALLGAFNYAISLKNTGSPVPNVAADATLSAGEGAGGRGELARRAANAGAMLWSFADLPGVNVPLLDAALARPIRNTWGQHFAFGQLGYSIDTHVHDDLSGFGAVGFFLLFPVLLAALLGRRIDGRRRLLALGAAAALATYLLLLVANPFVSRVLIPWVALAAPLLAVLALRAWTRTLAIALAFLSLAPSVLMAESRPVLATDGMPSIWARDRLAQQQLGLAQTGWAAEKLIAILGPTAPIGFIGSDTIADYPYFGEHLERRVVRLRPEDATPAGLRERGLAGIVFAEVGPPSDAFAVTALAENIYLGRPR